MAVFVLGGENGTDNALSGADNTETIPADHHGDFIIWNTTDTTVDVVLNHAGGATTAWTSVVPLHIRTHNWNNHRDFTVSGSTLTIRALQPQAVFAIRQTNAGSSTINYLDVSNCMVTNSGHGTPVVDGQEVHVTLYNIVSN